MSGTRHKFYVYSAYCDDRDRPLVRVIAATKTKKSDKVNKTVLMSKERFDLIFINFLILILWQVFLGFEIWPIIRLCFLIEFSFLWSLSLIWKWCLCVCEGRQSVVEQKLFSKDQTWKFFSLNLCQKCSKLHWIYSEYIYSLQSCKYSPQPCKSQSGSL